MNRFVVAVVIVASGTVTIGVSGAAAVAYAGVHQSARSLETSSATVTVGVAPIVDTITISAGPTVPARSAMLLETPLPVWPVDSATDPFACTPIVETVAMKQPPDQAVAMGVSGTTCQCQSGS